MATLNIKNLPDPLYKVLKERATSQHRSVAQEVTHLLTQALAAQEPLSSPELQRFEKELWSGVDAVRHVQDERASWA